MYADKHTCKIYSEFTVLLTNIKY